MRTGLIAVMVAAAALLGASSVAQAETWCRNGTMCMFSSYQKCVSSTQVMGGTCTRERVRNATPRVSSVGRMSYAQYSSTPLPTNLHPTRFSCSN